MARAGTCAVCGTTVYLNEDGSCQNGHGPENISGVYEVDPNAQPAPVAEAPKKKTGLIIVIVLVVLLLCCCVGGGAAALIVPTIAGVPVFNAAKENAEQQTCYANQRTIEGSAQAFYADNEYYPESVGELVDAEYMMQEPECPTYGSGAYEMDTDTGSVNVYCEHGHY